MIPTVIWMFNVATFHFFKFSSGITSSSNRDYTVSLLDGSVQTKTYQWRQTITYQSCPNDEAVRAVQPTQQLSVDQIFVMYDSGNQLPHEESGRDDLGQQETPAAQTTSGTTL